MKYLSFPDLDEKLVQQYRSIMATAFPKIIMKSQVMINCWEKVEKYFPQLQVFLLDSNNQIIGFMNTVPVFWDRRMNELPNEGWDWLVQKAIRDYENDIKPNTLGGLQIIVSKEYQNHGYSKQLITEAKEIKKKLGFQHFIIPIRPILKHKYQDMPMKDYMKLQKEDVVYDPWIKTHVHSGAKIIKVCGNSMTVTGDITFWEAILLREIKNSGRYYAKGALNHITIDVEKNYGEYREENIWINYQ